MTRQPYPGEVLLAEAPEQLSIRVGETAAQTAEAMLRTLVQRYGVRCAKEAAREALRTLPRQRGGRRPEDGGAVVDAILGREYRRRFRELKAAGLTAFKAKSTAIYEVAQRFSGSQDIGQLDRPAETIARRLRGLVRPRDQDE